MININQIINLEKYPINDIGSLKYKELTNYTRKQLNEDGCCVLPNFIKPDSIRKMKDEVDRNLSKIYFTSDKHNPYFTKDDKTLHEEHPKRIFTVRLSGYLNSDDLEKLYEAIKDKGDSKIKIFINKEGKNYLFELKDKRKFNYETFKYLNKEHYIKKINL